MKSGEEFVLEKRSFVSNEFILFKLETQLVSVHRWPHLYEQLAQETAWETISAFCVQTVFNLNTERKKKQREESKEAVI